MIFNVTNGGSSDQKERDIDQLNIKLTNNNDTTIKVNSSNLVPLTSGDATEVNFEINSSNLVPFTSDTDVVLDLSKDIIKQIGPFDNIKFNIKTSETISIGNHLSEVNFGIYNLTRGEFDQVQYISNTSGQYINTGVSDTNGVKVEARMSFKFTSSWQFMLGSQESKGTTSGGTDMPLGCDGGQGRYFTFRCGTGNTQSSIAIPADDVVFDVVSSTIVGNSFLTLNNETTQTYSMSGTRGVRPMYLFGDNDGGSIAHTSVLTIYSMKIYDSNLNLVRNFTPVKHKNIPTCIGLFDNVENKFYGNLGSGSFTAGPIVESGD